MGSVGRRSAAVCAALAILGALLIAWWPEARVLGPRAASADAQESARRSAEPRTGERSGSSAQPEVAPTREPVDAPPPAPVPPPAPPQLIDALAGRVLHVDRTPATGATVHLGRAVIPVGADGAFAFAFERVALEPGLDLVAVLSGYEPAVVADVADRADVRAGIPLEVVLPGPALEIDGWLITDTGTPCPDWSVELHAGTPSGLDAFPPLSAEDLAAGAVASRDTPRERFFEAADAPVSNPNVQSTGADGAFRIGGLRRGSDYVLRAWNQSTLQTVVSAPVPAGTRGFAFVVPTGVFRDRVDGRVVDRAGVPIAGVRVRLTMREHSAGGSTSYQTGQAVRTEVDGAFVFRAVPREDLLLRFDGARVNSLYHEFLADDPGVGLEIRLACAAKLRFEALAGGPEPTSIRILNADDEPLRISWSIAEGSTRSSRRCALDGGASPDLSVSDAATWLSLEVDQREVRRIPIRLDRRALTVVRG